MKTVLKLLTALAAIAGAVYVIATYGDKIVAWAKKVWAAMPKCSCCQDAEPVVEEAAAEGKVIKLLCRGYRDEAGNVIAKVAPEKVEAGDLLATVNSTTSIVSITTDLMKKVTVVEHEPEIEQTAFGVFGDLMRVLGE